eukprot:2368650-Pyramimonas_sp.AAC.1
MQKETPQPPPADPAFDRLVDTTILIARAKHLVAKDVMERALQPWLERVNLSSEDYVIEGNPTSK